MYKFLVPYKTIQIHDKIIRCTEEKSTVPGQEVITFHINILIKIKVFLIFYIFTAFELIKKTNPSQFTVCEYQDVGLLICKFIISET